MKRPLTIWLTQILLVIYVLLLLSVLVINLVNLLRHLDRSLSLVNSIVAYSIILGAILLFVAAFWGLARRAQYGRWLSLLSMILIWVLLLVTTFWQHAGPYAYYEYDNDTQLAGAIGCKVLIHALFLTLILRLAFARKIADFFVIE